MPLGWFIGVYRRVHGQGFPPAVGDPLGGPLAVWQAGGDGLRWVRELVEAGKAKDLGGDGYPYLFTAPASEVLPVIEGTPPGARDPWLVDEGDVALPHWLGKTTMYPEAIAACRYYEWLVIEVWDES